MNAVNRPPTSAKSMNTQATGSSQPMRPRRTAIIAATTPATNPNVANGPKPNTTRFVSG